MPTTPQPDTAQIRKELDNAFDDSGLSAFCFDYFPTVKNSFSQGMRKDEKIMLLLEYCSRPPSGFETLLDNVRKQYKINNFESKELKPLINTLEAYTSRLVSDKDLTSDPVIPSPKTGTYDLSQEAEPDPSKVPKRMPTSKQWVGYAIIFLIVSVVIIAIITVRPSITPTLIISPINTPTLSETVTPSTPSQPPEIIYCSETNDKMVLVEAGVFLRGSTEEDIEQFVELCPPKQDDPDCGASYFWDETPQTPVHVDLSFCIDADEVTTKQFEEFVQATGYTTTAEEKGESVIWNDAGRDWQVATGANWKYPKGPNGKVANDLWPVTQVSWHDADKYCKWLDKRLPTSDEWEKAARGTDGYLYPWGNNWNEENLKFYGKKPNEPVPVGSYPEGMSPYGAMDMLGNVLEWVNSRKPGNPEDPGAPKDPTLYERRGGGWASIELYLHTAWRNYRPPESTSPTTGFRCAKDG